MTRAEREMMIGRYMGGGMSSAEEQEFFIQVALDPELRLELKAHRTVESAMRKDRDAEPSGHTALRGRIASTLAAHPPQPQGLTSAAQEAGSSIAPGIAKTGMVFGKWAGGAVVFIVAAVWGVSLFQESEVESGNVPVIESQVRPAPALADSALSPSVVSPSSPEISQPSVDRSESGTEARPNRSVTAPEAGSPNERAGANKDAGAASTESGAREKPARVEHTLPDLDGSTTKRSSDDSMRIGVEIELPKK